MKEAALNAYFQAVIIEQEKQLAASGLGNHNVFEERLRNRLFPNFKKEPKFMYFYYVRINDNGKLKVSHYWYVDGDRTNYITWKTIPWDKGTLEGIALTLAKNARKSLIQQDPQPCDQINFKGIEWRQKSYIVIFFDEASWKFLKKAGASSPIVFLTDKDGTTAVENHTFFDALELDVEFSPTDTRSAVAFINHMKSDDDGTDIAPGDREEFQFNMFLGAEFEDGTDAPLTVIFDPGGTNQGPPIDP